MIDFLWTIMSWHIVSYTAAFWIFFIQGRIYFFTFTFYWHDSAYHKHYTIIPWFEHCCRFYMWVNSSVWYQGHLTRWTAEHYLHHKYTDQPGDPISPHQFPLRKLVTYEQKEGAARYVSPESVEKYGDHSVEPNDPFTMFYKKHQFKGMWINMLFWTILLGPIGTVIGYLTPKINQYYGVFLGDFIWHKFGYKHPNGKTEARNILPIVLHGGLHSNHHNNPNEPNKAVRWFELDLNYHICKLLALIKIIKWTNISQQKY